MPFNGKEIHLGEGQFITGRKTASQTLGISEQQFRTCLKYLINSQRISVKSTNKFSVITIKKWGSYQISDKKSTNKKTAKQPTNNQPVTTNNKDNKEKKEIPLESGRGEKVLTMADLRPSYLIKQSK
jgi:hypothetical protein